MTHSASLNSNPCFVAHSYWKPGSFPTKSLHWNKATCSWQGKIGLYIYTSPLFWKLVYHGRDNNSGVWEHKLRCKNFLQDLTFEWIAANPKTQGGLYSDCLWRESNFLVSTRPGHCHVRACLQHFMHVRLRNGYTQAYVEIMQHTHTH